MKKYIILMVMVFALSGCSMWSNWSWNWSVLNPWADSEDEVKEEPQDKSYDVVLPDNVNKYLWQACLDRLAFMGIERQTPAEGQVETGWKVLSSVPNERFKIVAEISSGELRADGLDIKVYREIKTAKGWVKTAPTAGFETQVGQAIITQAKILYINDKDKD